jgi:hypothetical protein
MEQLRGHIKNVKKRLDNTWFTCYNNNIN